MIYNSLTLLNNAAMEGACCADLNKLAMHGARMHGVIMNSVWQAMKESGPVLVC